MTKKGKTRRVAAWVAAGRGSRVFVRRRRVDRAAAACACASATREPRPMARAAGRENDVTAARFGGKRVSRPERRLATFRSSMSRAGLRLLPRRKSSPRWKREASPSGHRAFGRLSLQDYRPSAQANDRAPARHHVHAPCAVVLRRRRARRSWDRVRARLRTTAARAGRRPASLWAYRNGDDHTCDGPLKAGFVGAEGINRRAGKANFGPGASRVVERSAAAALSPPKVPRSFPNMAPPPRFRQLPLWDAVASL